MTVDDKRAAAAKRLAGIAQALGADATVELLPNNMAAGPCPACLDASRRQYRPIKAPLGPLDACPHPDQCMILHRIVMHLDDCD